MGKLTGTELHRLRYPPTPETWECGSKRRTGDGVGTFVCGMLNAGSKSHCSLCASKKPRNPKRPWADYVRIAVKAGISPDDFGKPWRPQSEGSSEVKTAPKKRRTASRKGT